MNTLIADYSNPVHQSAIQSLMNHYALDPMGGGEPLPESVLNNLVQGLASFGKAFTVLAEESGTFVGLINCIEGFSSFKAAPLLNIHDVVVMEGFRGKGVTQDMLAVVEQQARQLGCCKLTLEVLEGNELAQGAYRKFGFSGYELDPKMGQALFWQKTLK